MSGDCGYKSATLDKEAEDLDGTKPVDGAEMSCDEGTSYGLHMECVWLTFDSSTVRLSLLLSMGSRVVVSMHQVLIIESFNH